MIYVLILLAIAIAIYIKVYLSSKEKMNFFMKRRIDKINKKYGLEDNDYLFSYLDSNSILFLSLPSKHLFYTIEEEKLNRSNIYPLSGSNVNDVEIIKVEQKINEKVITSDQLVIKADIDGDEKLIRYRLDEKGFFSGKDSYEEKHFVEKVIKNNSLKGKEPIQINLMGDSEEEIKRSESEVLKKRRKSAIVITSILAVGGFSWFYYENFISNPKINSKEKLAEIMNESNSTACRQLRSAIQSKYRYDADYMRLFEEDTKRHILENQRGVSSARDYARNRIDRRITGNSRCKVSYRNGSIIVSMEGVRPRLGSERSAYVRFNQALPEDLRKEDYLKLASYFRVDSESIRLSN